MKVVGFGAINRLIVDIYRQPGLAVIASRLQGRPSLVQGFNESAPLHRALTKKDEQFALSLLSRYQVEDLCSTMVDSKGDTPFSLAVKKGCTQVVSRILDLVLVLNQDTIIGHDSILRHIFHVSISHKREDIVREVINSLPIWPICDLLSRQEPSLDNMNLIHVAAKGGHLGIMKLILGAYKTALDRDVKPWLATDLYGKKPLDYALTVDKEECACELLSMDMEFFCKMVDDDGNSLLSVALEKGLKRVASNMLGSGFPLSLVRGDGSTALHVIHESCSELCEQLLEKHPELIEATNKNGIPVLNSWLQNGNLGPLYYILKTQWRRHLLKLMSTNDDNPLHVIAGSTQLGDSDIEAAQLLIDAYRHEKRQQEYSSSSSSYIEPWLVRNKDGYTPLLLAIHNQREKLASYFLLVQIGSSASAKKIQDGVLFLAVKNGCSHEVREILDVVPKVREDQDRWLSFVTSRKGQNVLHVASKCSEEVVTLLVERFPELVDKEDHHRKTPLYYASVAGADWLIRLLLNTKPSMVKSAPHACVEACKRGHLSAIRAFTETTGFREACLKQRCTLVHDIKLNSCNDYHEFLTIPFIWEMRNSYNVYHGTPLHRALRRKDIHYVEALLTAGVKRSSTDGKGQSATSLLIELCLEDSAWTAMCQRVGIYEQITNFEEARSTLSVVAGLLATLTFAAGFTLPGGLNSDTGKVIMGKQASFIAFLLADTYAMCCSMLALFFLTSASKSKDDLRILFKVTEASTFLVMQSLYGSLAAFMTGVYVVLAPNILWPAIIVFCMCSLVAIVSTMFWWDKSTLQRLLDQVNSKRGKINKWRSTRIRRQVTTLDDLSEDSEEELITDLPV